VRHRSPLPEEQIAEAIAWQLLRRYGVVFRRLVQRESLLSPWGAVLRVCRGTPGAGVLVAVSGAYPLNLVGILTPGDAVPAVGTNRILYRDGVPVAVKAGEGRGEKVLVDVTPEERER